MSLNLNCRPMENNARGAVVAAISFTRGWISLISIILSNEIDRRLATSGGNRTSFSSKADAVTLPFPDALIAM